MTIDESIIASLMMDIKDLRHLVFVITEVLSATILLVFILVLVLGWRINKDRRKEYAQYCQQTFVNRAFQIEDDCTNKMRNMQYVYSQDHMQPSQFPKLDTVTIGTQNSSILSPTKSVL